MAISSSAVIAIGAGTLADIYEPAERGSKFGLFYAAPLLGPSLGPILGGALTQGFGWRAIFWFLVIFGGLNLICFLLFLRDTFRRERSFTYQTVLRRRTQERNQRNSQLTVVDTEEKAPVRAHADNSTLVADTPPLEEIKLSIGDVNPFPPLLLILRRKNNIAILFPSGESEFILFVANAYYNTRISVCVQLQHYLHLCPHVSG